MTTQRESRISGNILDALRARGVFCFKIQGGPTMMRGLPDIIACVDGHFVGLETKVPEKRGNVSVIQRRVHELMRQAGATVVVVCGVQEALAVIDRVKGA
jgi:Holliday junction resolvase